MTELTADTFADICSSEPVRAHLAASEADHAQVQRTTRVMMAGVLAITLVLGLAAYAWRSDAAIWVAGFGLVLLVWAATAAKAKAAAELKAAVMPHIAARAGLSYEPSPASPPGWEAVRRTLFRAVNDATFSDAFSGLVDGRATAFYEATLVQVVGAGKNRRRRTVFEGQVFVFRRRTPSTARILVTPDRGLFNLFKPARDLERVAFESDPDFERRFEAYSDQPAQAEIVLGSSELRTRLLELRGDRALFVQIDGEDTVVAVPGRNRFEPGDMGRREPGEARARRMFDDLCASLTLAKELGRRLA